MKPAVMRSSVKLQYGGGYDANSQQGGYPQQGDYRQQSQQGFTVGSTPSGPIQGGQQGNGGQVLWRLDRHYGVAGFSGVAGFTAEKKNYMYTPEDDDFFRPCALPYTLCSGDERPLSRWNMIEQKLTVSRIQALVKCSNAGAVLSSEGRGVTLWRMPGGEWNVLYKGESRYLNDGDQVSLDCNDPEGAVFSCLREGGYARQDPYAQQQQGGYGQQQGGYPQQGQQQQGQGQLPYGWEQLTDPSSGQVYYSNAQTGQTQWEPPQ